MFLHIHRERVGDLYTEFQSLFICKLHEPFKHRDRILILKVIFKMEVTEHHIIISHVIHGFSGKIISKQCGITFNKCMQAFFF